MPFKSHKLAVLAGIAAAALGGGAIAGAATGTTGATGRSGASASRPAPPRSTEKVLTGETATKVTQAALARVPGTVLRVSTEDGGGYEAHIRKADGSEVEVKVDKSFAVTSVDAHGGPRRP